MNGTIPNNNLTSIFNNFLLSQKFQQNFVLSTNASSHQQTFRSQSRQSRPLSDLQIIEICSLCFILVEQTLIFLFTFQKKTSKHILFDSNDQHPRQSQHPSSIILPAKSLLYNCLHRNWTRAYSFSNICLSFVYFICLILNHYHPSLLHYSSTTYYSLPLTLLQQIIINFTGFHLFIIAISILQYFIRYYRLLKMKYSLNIYSGRNLLITKHTNVALILSGSLALIFSYNYIFYAPRHSQTIILLPLITLNMVLLSLIDLIIFIIIIICCSINLLKTNNSIDNDSSFDDGLTQQQRLANHLRSTIEKSTCTKCYSKFLQKNRNLFKDTDSYSKLHSKFFSHHITSSARPSISSPDDKRKYSTTSYEYIPMVHDIPHHLRTSCPSPTVQTCFFNKLNRSHDDLRVDLGRNSTNDLFLQSILLKLKQQRSLCHLCYRLLLIFLLKYVLFTFPQHCLQMIVYVRQFHEQILKYHLFKNPNPTNIHQQSNTSNQNKILFEHNELLSTVCRFLFLFARFGDSLLLTRLPNLIKTYFPCWCHFNSKFLRKKQTFQRISHQRLMKNLDSSVNEPTSGDDVMHSSDQTNQQQESHRFKKMKHRRLRLHFQFIPLWSNKRQRLFKDIY